MKIVFRVLTSLERRKNELLITFLKEYEIA